MKRWPDEMTEEEDNSYYDDGDYRDSEPLPQVDIKKLWLYLGLKDAH